MDIGDIMKRIESEGVDSVMEELDSMEMSLDKAEQEEQDRQGKQEQGKPLSSSGASNQWGDVGSPGQDWSTSRQQGKGIDPKKPPIDVNWSEGTSSPNDEPGYRSVPRSPEVPGSSGKSRSSFFSKDSDNQALRDFISRARAPKLSINKVIAGLSLVAIFLLVVLVNTDKSDLVSSAQMNLGSSAKMFANTTGPVGVEVGMSNPLSGLDYGDDMVIGPVQEFSDGTSSQIKSIGSVDFLNSNCKMVSVPVTNAAATYSSFQALIIGNHLTLSGLMIVEYGSSQEGIMKGWTISKCKSNEVEASRFVCYGMKQTALVFVDTGAGQRMGSSYCLPVYKI